MALWQENFDFYEARAREGRAFISVDLAAKQHAPVASHPVRLQFRVKMKQPRPDGLRSEEEAEALFALEDKLVEAVQTKLEGIYVARGVAYGMSEFFFYVPAHLKTDGKLLPDTGGYQLEFFSERDPEWARYDELYPDAWSFQTIMNRRLLDQLAQAGDRHELTREVDHLALFPTKDQAERARVALMSADFRTDEVTAPKDKGEGWSLQFHRDEELADGAPDEFVAEVLELLEPHDGVYDGWGCGVAKADA
jgi:regulator of RNase E activity RraB